MNTKESDALKKRVITSRGTLKHIGVKSAIYYFCLKYPAYTNKKGEILERTRNLWYGKITNEQFTTDLEAFTTFKEVEFN